jgi:pyrroline-5-carboxylate reductase
MASAMMGGLLKQGWSQADLHVVEPMAEQRALLQQQLGLLAHEYPSDLLQHSRLVVWAVKPQVMHEAVQQAAAWVNGLPHLSVAAGIRTETLMQWLNTDRVVRAMPNTPALVGQGMTGLFACAGINEPDRQLVQTVLNPTGQFMWFEQESLLDAVTAVSGSGPAYVFYFLEAMTQAGADLGLSRTDAYHLAVNTFLGASQLAKMSDEPPEILRQRVTSKGGTTYAAISHMEQANIKHHFIEAMHAAAQRAKALGDELGQAHLGALNKA